MNRRLPFGFKFLPTDEELVDFYLRKRLEGSLQPNNLIMELDVYASHPELLLANYLEGSSEGYFFTTRGRKYDKGKVVNRVADHGFWKATNAEKVVHRNIDGSQIGKKQVLKYFEGTNSNKEGTDWIMHEYEMVGDPNKFQDMVICKIYNKGAKKIENPVIDFNIEMEDESLILQQKWHVPVEATNDSEWNVNDDNQMFDPDLLLQTLS